MTNWKHCISTITIPMITKLVTVVKYHKELPHPLMHMILKESVFKCYISTCRRPLDTNLGRVLTYHERLPPLNSNDPLIKWPTWGYVTIRKTCVSTFRRLWPLNLAKCWLWAEGAAGKHLSHHWLLFHLMKTALQKQYFFLMFLLYLHTMEESVQFH